MILVMGILPVRMPRLTSAEWHPRLGGGENGISAGSGNYALNWLGAPYASRKQSDDVDQCHARNLTTTTFDTNGINATWSGTLGGKGSLIKRERNLHT